MARSSEVQLPPLRTLDDFVCSSARFSLPDLKDPLRWNNRVINNLLYYQTNYLATVAAILLLVGYIEPLKTLLGGLVVMLLFLGFVWSAENKAAVRRLRRNHPTLCLLAVLLASYCLLSVVGGVAFFLFGITFPMLIHLSFATVPRRFISNHLCTLKLTAENAETGCNRGVEDVCVHARGSMM
ncbi:PRA1 family protein 2 isoform X1 [Stegostoma tigrinum]|nr:PRA1 family protein 2 isoform X1 [Stegostoma tigrinum]